jgi:beta-lactamase class A
MRVFALAMAACLLVGPLAAPGAASTVDLVVQVDGLVKAFPGDAGVYVADPLAPQPLYAHEADVVFIAASLYKLGLLVQAESLVDAGKLKYTDTVEIQPEDITTDGSYELSGTIMTVDEALESMITVSDNGTALAFWHLLGPENVNATLQKAGLAAFHIAIDENDDHTASARVIGQYFTLLAQRKLVSAAASDRMIARLERQQINDRLPSQLPSGTKIAHKTGNLGFVTHDAGIIYTSSGPRIVVGMTANTDEEEATHFLGGLGALVYSAVLEPPATARYRLPVTTLAFDAGSAQTQAIVVTNSGTKAWATAGAGSVGLIWDIRDTTKKVVASAPAPVPLPALAPASSTSVDLRFSAPEAIGDYTLTVGLADVNGNALAAYGAATGSYGFHVHVPYLVTSVVRVPQLVHRSEASLLIVQYSSLPAAGLDQHSYTLFWRAIDPSTGKSVASGSSPLGTSLAPGGGTFFTVFNAPALRGTYRVSIELREAGKTVSDTQTVTVEIAGPRSYPDDRDTAVQPVPRGSPPPRPSGAPPRPSGATPRGQTPAPTPTR